MINGRYYIGQHETKNLNDRYLGSGKLLKLAIKKYGRKSFKKSVLYVFSNSIDSRLKESELIDLKDPKCYNLVPGGGGVGIGGSCSEKAKEKSRARMLSNNPMKTLRTNSGSFVKGVKQGPNSKETKKKKSFSKMGNKNPNFGKPETANRLQRKEACKICGLITTLGNLKRWHNGKCL